jgi:hypothetical protein
VKRKNERGKVDKEHVNIATDRKAMGRSRGRGGEWKENKTQVEEVSYSTSNSSI